MAKEKKQVSLEAGLWNACNKLRGSVTATDYVNVVLGLLFLRFAFLIFIDSSSLLFGLFIAKADIYNTLCKVSIRK